MQALLSDLRARVILAQASGKPLVIHGGGTKDFLGVKAAGAALDMSQYVGVVSYEPTELVLTARAGTPLADIETLLAENGQMLAFEPPHFGPGATLGGCIATGLSGPRRAAAGSARDFVLGVKLLDAHGRILNFGGEVMKNVAGYDVSRLLAGSLGMLGVILEVSVKVLPRPERELTLRFPMREAAAIERLAAWAAQPLPISASAWAATPDGGELCVRLSGSPSAVESGRARLGGDAVASEAADAWWTSLREQTHPFFAARPLWRVAVPPTTAPLSLGSTLIEWNGGQRWVDTALPADAVRSAAAALGGHATLFRPASLDQARAVGVFHPLDPVVEGIHRRLKSEFDPQGIFNPGRMYAYL
jgi:glycolate oxidase FAD binding subunit